MTDAKPNRYNKEISGATTPSWNLMANQVEPQIKTAARYKLAECIITNFELKIFAQCIDKILVGADPRVCLNHHGRTHGFAPT